MTPEEIVAAASLPADRASQSRMLRSLAREIIRLKAEVERLKGNG